MTLDDAKAEAEAWVDARVNTIFSQAQRHRAWSSSVTELTLPIDNVLVVGVNDDQGRWVDTACGACFDERDTWAEDGIDIPAQGPVNLKLNSFKNTLGFGLQLAARFNFDGTIWERAWSEIAPAPSYDWKEVTDA